VKTRMPAITGTDGIVAAKHAAGATARCFAKR
jgi:hypothetical protein